MSLQRRRWMMGAVALGAGALGIGTARHLLRAQGPRSAEAQVLFDTTLPDRDGIPQPLRQWAGRVLVVNFWATWCPPCIAEIPDFMAAREAFHERGVEFLGIGIDQAAALVAFAQAKRIPYPIFLAGYDGHALAERLGNTDASLPYTLVLDRMGRVVTRHRGRMRAAQLHEQLTNALEQLDRSAT